MKAVNRHIAAVTLHNIESLLCTEDERRRRKPWRYRTVARVARMCGTIGFLFGNAGFFAGWVLFNHYVLPFDPYPYTFLLFGVSLEAIFLSVLILISQNMDAAESERRHHLDLQMNLLTEREMTAVMRLLIKVAERLGVEDEDTKEVRDFAHETDPTAVLTQIVAAERKHRG